MNTYDREVLKDDYIDAVMDVTTSTGGPLYSNTKLEIKGRGTSTWTLPKKPYKLKLDKEQLLLDMSTNKHWTLIANYSDKSLLRNVLAFELSRVLGMHWTVKTQPVELYMNGEYEGLYMLTEHVRVAPERINLDVVGPADNSGEELTGGYLLMVDSRKLKFRTARGLPVGFEEPEVLTSEQRSYIEGFVRQTEVDIYELPMEEYSKAIDIESFVQYFLVQEISKNMDGDMRLSTPMWKLRNGKLGFPCVWDFDISFGNCNYHSSGVEAYGWHVRNGTWYEQLFRDPAFAEEVTAAWRQLYPKLPEVEATVREWARVIDEAQERNFQRWDILNTKVWGNVVVTGSYQGELDYMLGFFRDRVEWMNTEIEAGRHLKTD